MFEGLIGIPEEKAFFCPLDLFERRWFLHDFCIIAVPLFRTFTLFLAPLWDFCFMILELESLLMCFLGPLGTFQGWQCQSVLRRTVTFL